MRQDASRMNRGEGCTPPTLSMINEWVLLVRMLASEVRWLKRCPRTLIDML